MTAVRNQSRSNQDIAIFEIGSVFRNNAKLATPGDISVTKVPDAKTRELIYNSVPIQPLHVGAIVAGKLASDSWHSEPSKFTWVEAIEFARNIIEATGSVASVTSSDFAPWHPGRCAELQVDGKAVAHAGELHPKVLAQLGLPERSCAFVVVLSALPFLPEHRIEPLRTMPAAIQDLALIVESSVPSDAVRSALIAGAGDLLESITLFDRYDKLEHGKVSLAFTLVFRAKDRTLTAQEVSEYREAAAASALKACGAKVRV